MRTFICLAIFCVFIHFNIKPHWLMLISMFLWQFIAVFQDIKELHRE